MAPLTFTPQAIFVHAGALDYEVCKGQAIWPVNEYSSQWYAADQSTQLPNTWECHAEQSAQLPNRWEPHVEQSLQLANTWEPQAWPCWEQGPCSGNVWPSQMHYAAEPSQGCMVQMPQVQIHQAQPSLPEALASAWEMWRLARDKKGCRQLQEALEYAASDDERVAVAAGLRGHVLEATRCANANHVLQKCINTMRPVDTQFIIDEMSKSASMVARHRFGVRVLERLLEHCSPAQMDGLLEELLCDAVELSAHIYGNYIMQHILEHGTESHKLRITMLLAGSVPAVCQTMFGCAVASKSLEHASQDARLALAHALLLKPHILVQMACLRHGHQTAKLALQTASSPQRDAALPALAVMKGTLLRSRYGRALNTYLEECLVQ